MTSHASGKAESDKSQVLELSIVPSNGTSELGGSGLLNHLRNFERRLELLLGGQGLVETQGVDRILEEEKRPPSIWNALLIWPSLMIHVGIIPIGILGPELGLSLKQGALAAMTGVLLGACCPAFTGSLGPELGLRQIAIARYSFGFWGAKLCSMLNVIVSAGFAVINTVVVGQILSAVSGFHLSIVVGCVIIAIAAYCLAFFGFRIINWYLQWSWIVSAALFAVLYSKTVPLIEPSAQPLLSGQTLIGAWLSFATICFSTVAGWCTYPSDYYCNFPASTSRIKIGFLTWVGLSTSSLFTIILGVIIGNAISTPSQVELSDEYSSHGFGGALLAIYGYGPSAKACLVLCLFTILGNNTATNYSSGLSLQLLGTWYKTVPRFIWSLLVSVCVAALAIAGRESLSTVISNFVSLIAYWAVCFTFILTIEDSIFRRRIRYDLDAWNSPKSLPVGIAAVSCLLIAYCGGGIPGMNQTWFTGPIAKLIGDQGGDVGVPMTAGLTILFYPALRAIERNMKRR